MWVKTADGRAIINTDRVESIETAQDPAGKIKRSDAVRLVAQFSHGDVELCADGGEIALTEIINHLAAGDTYLYLGSLGGVR